MNSLVTNPPPLPFLATVKLVCALPVQWLMTLTFLPHTDSQWCHIRKSYVHFWLFFYSPYEYIIVYSASKQRYLTKNGRKGECHKYIVQLTTPGMTVLYQRWILSMMNDFISFLWIHGTLFLYSLYLNFCNFYAQKMEKMWTIRDVYMFIFRQ